MGEIKEEFQQKLKNYEKSIGEKEKLGEENVKAIEEILKQTEEDADKVEIYLDGIISGLGRIWICPAGCRAMLFKWNYRSRIFGYSNFHLKAWQKKIIRLNWEINQK